MAIDPITVAKLWMVIRPIKRLKERRKAKRAERNGQASPVETKEVSMLQGKKTYLGIGTVAIGLVLGWLGIGDCAPDAVDCQNAEALSAQIMAALDQLLMIGGLLFAAYGRAKAKPTA